MSQNYAVPQIKEAGDDLIFQQDGAPPHWAHIVRDYLNETFPNQWIGRGAGKSDGKGLLEWPPRLPDLTPLDFFLWGHVKQLVFRVKVRDMQHLIERIAEAVSSITPRMLCNVWRDFEYRLDIARATNGAHIELH